MTSSRVTLGDHTLIALYTKFQEARRSLRELYPGLRHDDSFLESRSYDHPASMMIMLMAQEHILTATNTINRLSYDLHSLTAWSKVFQSATEDERMQALYEFVTPIAAHSLSMPYSIKQILVKSVSQLSHQTNRFCINDWSERLLNEKPNFKDAKRLAGRYHSWPALCAALSLLNSENFTNASDDYRNEFNHGFPRRIELGYTTIIRRDPKSASYEWRDAPPLSISDLIPLLAAEHEAACDSYQAYIGLIKEQHELWPGLLCNKENE